MGARNEGAEDMIILPLERLDCRDGHQDKDPLGYIEQNVHLWQVMPWRVTTNPEDDIMAGYKNFIWAEDFSLSVED